MTAQAPPLPARRRTIWPKRQVLSALLGALATLCLVALLEVTGVTFLVARNPQLAAFFGEANENLKIIAVYSTADDRNNFLRGAQMAVDRLNTADGGVLGRKLELDLVSEKGATDETALEDTVARTLDLSDHIARTRHLLAVIGHEWSDTAVAASSIYSLNNILYLATHATAQALTNHDFKTVFALQPDNSDNAQMVASYAVQQGLHRFLVLSDKSDYGKESANFFSAAVTGAGAEVTFRGFLSSGLRSTDQLLMFILDNKSFQRSDFDAIFIVSSSLEETADFIKRARALRLDVPILGMEYMFSSTIEDIVGKPAMRDVVGVSLYDRDNISDKAMAFVGDFSKAYGYAPDLDAALGYDAVAVLGDAAVRAGTIDPAVMSDTLKLARYKVSPFVGVTGPLLFDRNGLVTDTHVFIVRHDGEAFHTVAQYAIPGSIAQIDVPDESSDSELENAPSGAGASD